MVNELRYIGDVRLAAGAVRVRFLGAAQRVMAYIEEINQPCDISDIRFFHLRAVDVSGKAYAANIFKRKSCYIEVPGIIPGSPAAGRAVVFLLKGGFGNRDIV